MRDYKEIKKKYEHIFKLKGKELIKHIGKDVDPHGFVLLSKDQNFLAEVFFEQEKHVLFTQIGNSWFMSRIFDSTINYTHIELIIEIVKCYSSYDKVFKRRLKDREILYDFISDRCIEILKFLKYNNCKNESHLYNIMDSSDQFDWIDIYGKSGRFWESFNILSLWYAEDIITKRDIEKLIELIKINKEDLILTFYEEHTCNSYIKLYEELETIEKRNVSNISPAIMHTIAAKKRIVEGFGSANNKLPEMSHTQYWQSINTSE